jgi:hypothetical protein
MFKKPRVEGSEKPSQQIKVFDLKTNTTYYNSKCEASRALNINHLVINIYFLVIKLSLIKGRFVFYKVVNSYPFGCATSRQFHNILSTTESLNNLSISYPPSPLLLLLCSFSKKGRKLLWI